MNVTKVVNGSVNGSVNAESKHATHVWRCLKARQDGTMPQRTSWPLRTVSKCFMSYMDHIWTILFHTATLLSQNLKDWNVTRHSCHQEISVLSDAPGPTVFNPFQSISIHFNPFQSISIHFNPFQSISIHFNPFQSISIHFNPFQSISIHFNLSSFFQSSNVPQKLLPWWDASRPVASLARPGHCWMSLMTNGLEALGPLVLCAKSTYWSTCWFLGFSNILVVWHFIHFIQSDLIISNMI